jgi:hypothetical protein
MFGGIHGIKVAEYVLLPNKYEDEDDDSSSLTTTAAAIPTTRTTRIST